MSSREREQSGTSAAIETAYQRLAPSTQRVLCLLAAHPLKSGIPGIGATAVAALTNLDAEVGEHLEHLEQLSHASLVELAEQRQNTDADSWYKLHDLVRDHLREKAEQPGAVISEDEIAEAIDRLFTYYWRTARETAAAAEPVLTRHTRPEVEPDPAFRNAAAADRQDGGTRGTASARTAALDWFEQHRVHLLACLDYADNHDLRGWVVRLTSAMAGFLRNHGPWDQAVKLHERAAGAAGPPSAGAPARAVALNDEGITYRLLGEYGKALDKLRQAHAIFSGDLPAHISPRDAMLGRANALNEQGIVYNKLGEHTQAVHVMKEALALYRAADDAIGIANATKNLGVAQYHIGLRTQNTGLQAEAREQLDRAINHYDELGDVLGRVEVLNYRGFLELEAGDIDQAFDSFMTARTLVSQVGSLLEKARALEGIGRSEAARGDVTAATEFLERARKIYEEIGADSDRDGTTKKLNEMWETRNNNQRWTGAAG